MEKMKGLEKDTTAPLTLVYDVLLLTSSMEASGVLINFNLFLFRTWYALLMLFFPNKQTDTIY